MTIKTFTVSFRCDALAAWTVLHEF